jgi:hypothetical protein
MKHKSSRKYQYLDNENVTQLVRLWIYFLEITRSSPINIRATGVLHGC